MSVEHAPTKDLRDKVEAYAAVGIPQDDIARVLDIDAKTLRKHYRAELDTASIKANAAIGGALFSKAKGGDSTAMIWWSKCRMGWREAKTADEGKDDIPVRVIEFFEEDARVERE